MAKCEKCGVEIIGKSYTRMKYRWKSRMPVPVQFCKACYLETEDDKSINPAVLTLFTSIATLLVIWIILFAS